MKLIRPAAMLCALTLTLGGVTVLAATQGSQEDPLITLSYLESVLKPQLKQEVDAAVKDGAQAVTDKLDAAVADYESRVNAALAESAATFQTKDLEQGATLLPGAGRELLVVSGKLTAIGQLTDTTAGKSVADGAALEAGHLYITSAANSGCKAAAASAVMSR